MLERLFISNFALVGELELEFEKGLILLTGETGAGKSLLMGALSSLLGARLDGDLIVLRDRETSVEGVFSGFDSSFADTLEAMGITAGSSVTIRRRLDKKGKNSAFVNGFSVTLTQLRELAPGLLEIHGQHQNVRLLDSSTHGEILDATPEIKPSAEAVAALSDRVKKACARCRLVLGKAGEIDRRIQELLSETGEIAKIAPKEDEDEDLRKKRNVLQNSSKVLEDLNLIQTALGQDGHSALSIMKDALKKAEELSEFQPKWAALAKELEEARRTLAEIRDEAERDISCFVFDPGELERVEERLFDLEKLKRKFGPKLRDVMERFARSSEELEDLKSLPLDSEAVKKELDAAFEEYLAAASSLSEKRKSFAPVLSKKIENALKPLALEKARFGVGFEHRPVREPQDATGKGLEEAFFLFSANEGEPMKPLSKIASGGEMSRTVLAVLCSSGGSGSPGTVVFDEIDSGIGGRPAEKVGSYLSSLSKGRQIICITHLPQIAAFADQHIRVEKGVLAGRTLVTASQLENEREREEELARMLAGEKITESAKLHARELMKAAGKKK